MNIVDKWLDLNQRLDFIEQLQNSLEHTQRLVLVEDEQLVVENFECDCMFYVLSGTLEVGCDSSQGSVVLATVGPGEFLGEMGLLQDKPSSATVTAKSRCELAVIEQEQVRKLIGSTHPLVIALVNQLINRIRVLNQHIAPC